MLMSHPFDVHLYLTRERPENELVLARVYNTSILLLFVKTFLDERRGRGDGLQNFRARAQCASRA